MQTQQSDLGHTLYLVNRRLHRAITTILIVLGVEVLALAACGVAAIQSEVTAGEHCVQARSWVATIAWKAQKSLGQEQKAPAEADPATNDELFAEKVLGPAEQAFMEEAMLRDARRLGFM